MTTIVLLIAMLALLVVGGAVLLRGVKAKKAYGWKKVLVAAVFGVGLAVLIWLAIMVFVVGPSMRAI